MKIRTNDGRGVIVIDADAIRGELGFTNFYKKHQTTLRCEATLGGVWPFRYIVPARDETSTRDEWVLSLATDIIVEMRPDTEKEPTEPELPADV